MPTIAHQGIKLAFEDRGAGQPAFVFVHGWACDRSFFAPQADHFVRRHRVVSVDLRGHGESDKPPGPYPIAAYANDTAYIIEHLGLGKAVAVGHSMGGLTVLQLAAAHPHSVEAIVMIDPARWGAPRAALGMISPLKNRSRARSSAVPRASRRLAVRIGARIGFTWRHRRESATSN